MLTCVRSRQMGVKNVSDERTNGQGVSRSRITYNYKKRWQAIIAVYTYRLKICFHNHANGFWDDIINQAEKAKVCKLSEEFAPNCEYARSLLKIVHFFNNKKPFGHKTPKMFVIFALSKGGNNTLYMFINSFFSSNVFFRILVLSKH